MMRNLVLLLIGIVCLVYAEHNIGTPLFQNEDTIKYDGANSSGFGLPNGGTFFAAVRFHPQQSCTLKSIIFFQYQPVVTGCWIYLYEEGQPTYPGVKIDSIFYLGMPGPGGWVRLNFTTPHFRAGGVDFWLSIKLTHNQGQIPLGVDAGPSITPAHSFISPDGNIWQTLPAYGQNKNFNIRAIVRYIQPGFDIGIDEILINSISPPNIIINLQARIKNYGISFSTNVPVTCSILGPGGVLRYANTFIIASLAPGDTVHFSFGTWTPTIIEEMTIIMRLLIIDEVPANDREVLIPIPLTYFQDFEATNGGYVPTGIWEWGVPTFPPNAHSGIKVWGTGIYPNNCNASLRTFEFVVNDNNPVLKFWHWYNINWGDGGNVKISTNNGATWTIISPIFGYPGIGWQGSPVPNESCYFATCTTWTEAVFNLPLTSGQRFIIRWHFFSDNAHVAHGWYIDDVTGINFIEQLSEIEENQKNSLSHPTMLNPSKPNLIINNSAHLSFSLAEPSQTSLNIYDASGRLVKTIVDEFKSSGVYNIIWDGKDEQNQNVAQGVYFYSLETPKYNDTRKIVFIR